MADYAAIHHEQERRARRTLITPEGVDLNLRLADTGQRIAAFAFDLLLMVLFLGAITILLAVVAISGGRGWWQASAILWLLGFFLLRNGYFIVMEMGPRAATFGKRIVGIRVVARNGARLTADAVIARNLMRELEVYLPLSFLASNGARGLGDTATTLSGLLWTGLFLFFPLFNRDRLRVGDLLAGTWVVNSPKRKLGLDLIGQSADQPAIGFTSEQLDVYGAYELQTLEQVLRVGKGDALETVARTIRIKIGSSDGLSDAEFLAAFYEALRLHLERKLLFGKRRIDKHDREEGPGPRKFTNR